jgi:flagellar biosynthesis/type III secretory pathway protein FliH
VLRVHPDDLAAVEDRRPRWLGGEESPGEVSLVADPSVGRYGCVVETPAGRLDARLKTQLDVLERVLVRGLASRE